MQIFLRRDLRLVSSKAGVKPSKKNWDLRRIVLIDKSGSWHISGQLCRDQLFSPGTVEEETKERPLCREDGRSDSVMGMLQEMKYLTKVKNERTLLRENHVHLKVKEYSRKFFK